MRIYRRPTLTLEGDSRMDLKETGRYGTVCGLDYSGSG